MKTLVYQSYRTVDVPDWIGRCLHTVEGWAGRKGFAYEFVDDRLFDHVPGWYKRRVNGNKVLMSDLARLELAREFLAAGYERTIWVDADVVVFDPDRFEISARRDYAFCKEAWIDKLNNGESRLRSNINNAVSVFCRNNDFLDFYIYSCKAIIKKRKTPFRTSEVGTKFLTRLARSVPLPVLTNVGLFSPVVNVDIAEGGGPCLDAHMTAFGHPLRAGNLCASFRGRPYNGITMTDSLFERVIDRLIDTGGGVLNDRFEGRD